MEALPRDNGGSRTGSVRRSVAPAGRASLISGDNSSDGSGQCSRSVISPRSGQSVGSGSTDSVSLRSCAAARPKSAPPLASARPRAGQADTAGPTSSIEAAASMPNGPPTFASAGCEGSSNRSESSSYGSTTGEGRVSTSAAGSVDRCPISPIPDLALSLRSDKGSSANSADCSVALTASTPIPPEAVPRMPLENARGLSFRSCCANRSVLAALGRLRSSRPPPRRDRGRSPHVLPARAQARRALPTLRNRRRRLPACRASCRSLRRRQALRIDWSRVQTRRPTARPEPRRRL